ncbi:MULTISPECIES: HAD hydrolase-like protein [Spirulina sp. CCY15215]|uniref:HAD hydrolase-like protein n=1 Tax=Spirulina sp. CCY15215 TaxID=2767591 RepID=UPI00194E5587|nr:HAD hydrolase-like protein [Spirulina major]
MTIELVIFDFDGTIADTHSTFVEIINQLSEEFGYKPVTDAEVAQMRGLSSREIVQRSEISIFKIPFLLRRAKEELNQKIANILPISGIEISLNALIAQEIKLGILTSNIEKNVSAFLKENNLENIFEFIYSGNTIFGKDRILRKLLQEYNIDPNLVVYVGDETRDINAAKKSGVKAIAVTWGFNSQEILQQHQPDLLVDCPQSLAKAIASLF